jgi:hypothetical protein
MIPKLKLKQEKSQSPERRNIHEPFKIDADIQRVQKKDPSPSRIVALVKDQQSNEPAQPSPNIVNRLKIQTI